MTTEPLFSYFRATTSEARMTNDPNGYRHYTADEDDIICAGWAAYAGVEDIAQRLGRSPRAIRQRAWHLGLHHRPGVTLLLRQVPPEIAAVLESGGERAFIDAAYAWRRAQRTQYIRKWRATHHELRAEGNRRRQRRRAESRQA
jgi:hypothetical protein